MRSETPATTALIDEGIARSKTLARLVETIDRTDGLVYVEYGTCSRGVRACLAMSVTLAGPNRLLRIVIDPRGGERRLCSLGHELQHAVEILSDPTIRSTPALVQFYAREWPTAGERFETPAAIRAGLDVCADLGIRSR